MYIGGFIVLLGFGFYEQSAAILLFTLLWFLSAPLFVILYEEPHRRATFGSPYDVYCRSVRRLPTPKLRDSNAAGAARR
jgi:protein-S-isoprenylcysteine O-methyltransferase Ste14